MEEYVNEILSNSRVQATNNAAMEQAVQQTVARAIEARPVNTNKTYKYKQKEFMEWCGERDFDDGCFVKEGKLLLFLTQVVEKQGNKLHRKKNANGPPKALGVKTYQAYVSAMMDLYNVQITLGKHQNPNPNGRAIKSFITSCRRGEATRKREQYADRGTGTQADRYNLKDMIRLHDHYLKSKTSNQLRNRGDFLIAHSMLMRGESRRMLQLADIQMVEDLENEGPTPCPALILTMDQNKTNQFGRLQSGTAMRAKNVETCPIGAVSFLLFDRLEVQKESFPDFSRRENWYDTYLLITDDPRKGLSPDAHRDAQKRAFRAVNLLLNDVVHKPRKVGANIMANAGVAYQQIEIAGRWSTGALAGAYLESMPREAMRAVAKFPITGGSFFLPRAVAPIPPALLSEVFPSVEMHLDRFAKGEYPADIAGVAFLNALKIMRPIFLQDAAQLQPKHPRHPIFQHPLFQTNLWKQYAEVAQQTSTAEAPLDHRLQLAMPAMANLMNDQFRNTIETVKATSSQLSQKLDNSAINFDQFKKTFDDMFVTGTSPLILCRPEQAGLLVVAPGSAQRVATTATVGSTPEDTSPTTPCATPTENEFYKMSRTITTVIDVHREYEDGLGGNPAVKKLESKYGTSWRNSQADRKFFSRRKIIYDEIAKISTERQLAAKEAAHVLEARRIELKLKLSSLQDLLKAQ